MIELIEKLQRAGKLDIREEKDAFAWRIPRHDEHTGELLGYAERSVDLDALIEQRIRLQDELRALDAVIAMLTNLRGGRA